MTRRYQIMRLAFCLSLLVAPSTSRATSPVPCTGNKGMMLKCSGEVMPDVFVRPSGNGTYSYVTWKQYFGTIEKWRSISLYDTGQTHFVVNPGASKASKWWTFSHWIFPRKQKLTVSKSPGELRFEIIDSTGMTWTLSGTQMTQTRTSFVVTQIGDKKQEPIAPRKTERGVMGVDLAAARPFYLRHRRTNFRAYTNYQAPKYLRAKSTFHDHRGNRCAVPNRNIFDPMPNPNDTTDHIFKLDTDDKLIEFLSVRCPKLDLASVRVPTQADSPESRDVDRESPTDLADPIAPGP